MQSAILLYNGRRDEVWAQTRKRWKDRPEKEHFASFLPKMAFLVVRQCGALIEPYFHAGTAAV
jgi:hypothetical protein